MHIHDRSHKHSSNKTQAALPAILFTVDNPDNANAIGTATPTADRMAVESFFRITGSFVDSHSSIRLSCML